MVATRRKIAGFALSGILLQGAAPSVSFAQQPQPPKPSEAQSQQEEPRSPIRVTSELVLANVVVRDKKGNLVRDLKKDDFTLFEDGKKQEISTFDFENVDELETAGAAEKTVTGEAAEPAGPAGVLKKSAAPVMNARDRRVVVLFFDFSAMEPDQIDRCVEAAKKYINAQMRPADIVALVSLATNMHVDLDFTEDKTKILSVLSSYSSGSGARLCAGRHGQRGGNSRNRRLLHAGRHGLQHVQRGLEIAGAAIHDGCAGKNSTEKVADLFQQRDQPDGYGQPVGAAIGDGLGGQE